jgi:hypothetical protein
MPSKRRQINFRLPEESEHLLGDLEKLRKENRRSISDEKLLPDAVAEPAP